LYVGTLKLLFLSQACGFWSQWSEWAQCSASCDGGFQVRERICINAYEGSLECPGDFADLRICNSQVSN